MKPLSAGNTTMQMGGWFNKEINSLDDIKGLKIRMPGLGGEVWSRLGATTVVMPGGEIFTALQTGAIDATDWVGPYNDLAFGLHKAAKYNYFPGWQEPQAVVPAHAWQAAESTGDWTLVGCTVAPGFEFAGFELAPQGWEPSI